MGSLIRKADVHFRTSDSTDAHKRAAASQAIPWHPFSYQLYKQPLKTGPEDAICQGMYSTITTPDAAEKLNVRVLVADDQVHVLDALQLLLKSHGYRTETVTDPASVMPALKSESFDLVLMDMNYERDTTAGAEGLQLVSEIREKDPTVPLVVMTAWGSVDLAVEAMRRGASDFIQKPWENQQLISKLRTQLERARTLRIAERSRVDEIQQAQEIQSKLVPSRLPAIADYEIAAITKPVRFVGGDYYNVVRVSESETVFCIADVAGKGLPAALLMSSLQAALKSLMAQRLSPRELCRRLNRILCDITPVGKFISFFYGVLNNEKHRLTYCNAGHNPPIMIRRGGDSIELNAAGAVLGQFPDWIYEQSDIQLGKGDALVLFTDGLVEASDRDEEAFGESCLVSAAREGIEGGAKDVMQHVLECASRHCEGCFQDDATMIVVKAI